jgi:hypothetical protein
MKVQAAALPLGDPAECPEISVGEVAAAMAKLDLYKAGGADGIQPWMIRLGGAAMSRVLCIMFNAMWTLCYIPKDWKLALVVPIFKKGDPADPGNYRPISLLSVPGKVFSRVINDLLYERLEKEGLLPDEQGGFRRDRGCPEMILGLYSLIECRRRQGCATYLAFVDVKKAYDTVSRAGLALRLLELGTPQRVVSLVKEWYTGDSACILMGGLRSDWFEISLGVKQGDISSPILFSCYINSIVKEFDDRPKLGVELGDGRKRLAIQLFADDMVLMAESAEMLQEMLKVLSDFVDRVRLKVSTGLKQDKSAVMVYGSSVAGSTSFPVVWFQLCEERIPIVEVYRYLGVMLDHEGSWEPQLRQLRSSVGLRISEMRSAGMHQNGLPVRRGRDLIRTEVNPVLEYASGVWVMSKAQVDLIVSIWNKAVRYAAGVSQYVSMPSLIGDLDLLESIIPARWLLFRVTLWHRIMCLDDDRMVKRCVLLWRHVQRRHRSWESQVLQDLMSLKLIDTFSLHPEGMKNVRATSSEKWLALVREALLANVIWPQWIQDVKEREHLRLYLSSTLCTRPPIYASYTIPDTKVTIRKKEPIFQRYLDRGDAGIRRFQTVFRAGSLPLQTCARSYFRCGGVAGSVMCFMCGMQPETLSHFMNECPAYDDIKAKVAMGGVMIDATSIVCRPDETTSCDTIKMLFHMWLRRIRIWRRTHPLQNPVQPLL